MNKDDPSAAQKFQEVSEAYEILSDDGKRQQYDTFGMAGDNMGAGGPFQGAYQRGAYVLYSHCIPEKRNKAL